MRKFLVIAASPHLLFILLRTKDGSHERRYLNPQPPSAWCPFCSLARKKKQRKQRFYPKKFWGAHAEICGLVSCVVARNCLNPVWLDERVCGLVSAHTPIGFRPAKLDSDNLYSAVDSKPADLIESGF